jgi:hypothetical protein
MSNPGSFRGENLVTYEEYRLSGYTLLVSNGNPADQAEVRLDA